MRVSYACPFGLCYQISMFRIHKTDSRRSKGNFFKSLSEFWRKPRGDGRRTRSCPFADQLPSKTIYFRTSEFFERGFLAPYPQERLPFDSRSFIRKKPLVSKLFCWILRRSTDISHSSIYREPKYSPK
jgi:hypothetical protein